MPARPIALREGLLTRRQAAALRGVLCGLGGATNLCTNGGFETNTTGWNVSGGNTITRDTVNHFFGAASGAIAATGAFTGTNTTISGVAGITYTASAYVLNTSGVAAEMRAFRADAVTTLGVVATPSTAGWIRYSVTFIAVATESIVLFFRSTAAGTPTWNIDGVQLETGGVASPYVETNGARAAAGNPLIRLWTCQDTAGTTLVDDTGNDSMALAGGFTLNAPGNRLGSSVLFNGSSGKATGAHDATNALNGVTILALANPRNNGANQTIYHEDTTLGVPKLMLRLVNSPPSRFLCGGQPTDADAPGNPQSAIGSIVPGVPVLIGGAMDLAAKVAILYKNGIKLSTTDESAAWTTSTAFEAVDLGLDAPTVGVQIESAAATLWLISPVSFIAIFNRVLTDGEHYSIARACGFH